MNSKSWAYAALSCAAACWGLAPVATRALVAHFDPLSLLLIRFSAASLIFLPMMRQFFAWAPRDRIKMAGLAWIAVLGYYVPVTIGGQYIPSSLTGLLAATQTLWMAGLAITFKSERITRETLAGICVSTAGVGLLLFNSIGQPSGNNLLLGGGLTLFAAAMWAVYSYLLQPLARQYGALPCTGMTVIFGVIPLLFSINQNLSQEVMTVTPPIALALAVLTLLSTVIGNYLYGFGLVRLSGVKTSMFLYLNPLVSVLGGVIILGEDLTLQVLISGLFIIGGIAIGQMKRSSSATCTTE